ncbi:outer membrane beta-barrel protein [Caulobacter sp. S45]|uniref:outer membrane beta-barrel protein n=1 Tax=Caulobacter sp. S45 TaxID=1641861 RepID=UPI001574F316|nr:outer membrane beta-barrel protein [Caulobacter sp. S45]
MKRLFSGAVTVFVSTLLYVMAGSLARAQTLTEDVIPENFIRDRSVGVLERKRPGYDAIPVQVGSFDLLSSLDAGVVYDNNILARSDLKEADEIGVVGGKAQLISNWASNSLELDAHAEHDGNVHYGSESETIGGVAALGQLDISRDLQLRGRIGFDHLFEPRLSSGAPTFTRNPVEYNRGIAEIAALKTFNRLTLELAENHRTLHYDNAQDLTGAVVAQGYRNEDRDRITARADYAVSPDTAVFVQAVGSFRNFPSRTGLPEDLNRNSIGGEVAGGVRLDLPKLVSGEAALGYIVETFNDPRIANASGFGARGRLEFFPTGLTTVTFDGLREFTDSALALSPLVLFSSAGAEVDHELYRNIILTGRFNYQQDQYLNINRRDNRPSVTLGVNYLMNRRAYWKLSDTFLRQDSTSNDKSQTYSDNQLTLVLTLNY